eukprot:TRINITY_DN49156_c0_g1_i1.p1 TRINITY_DN49156_c0_g1~~TRINITY_DN49156_c0_g1_i1.p1  ORF type:complete len:102 (-),score=11.43 TRINITY_DN49156_c0_g1_i1:291-596(-)
MIRRPPRSTLSSSSAASDVYKRQLLSLLNPLLPPPAPPLPIMTTLSLYYFKYYHICFVPHFQQDLSPAPFGVLNIFHTNHHYTLSLFNTHTLAAVPTLLLL